jgi:hypothetical protein
MTKKEKWMTDYSAFFLCENSVYPVVKIKHDLIILYFYKKQELFKNGKLTSSMQISVYIRLCIIIKQRQQYRHHSKEKSGIDLNSIVFFKFQPCICDDPGNKYCNDQQKYQIYFKYHA